MRADRTLAVVASLVLAACALKSAPPRGEIESQALLNLAPPPQWATGASGSPVADNWLVTIDDPWLNELVKEAIAYNADLRIAAARVDTAAAYLAAANAPLFPQVNLLARGGGKMSGDSSGLSGVGLFASWELDLWGRVRSATRATELQYESVALDTEYARQSLAAMVVKSWILAIEARLQRDQAAASLRSSQQLASLAGDRFRVGSGDEYELTVAQSGVETYQDAVRNLDLAYRNALRALEALLGRYPAAAVTVAAQLPRWPGAIPAGLPSELLERRPDVIAAERRVAMAFYRTEEAKAALLPRITLSANFTSISSELFVLQDRNNPLFSAGAALVQPIFQGGLLRSQVEARTAEQQAAVAEYGKVGIRAFGEVEGALSAATTAEQREDILVRAVRENERGLDLVGIRYRVGSSDLRAVQQQQLALYSARVALVTVQAERLIQRVNLHLALGGSFEPTPAAKTGDASGVAR
ncbi:MAG TPA: TolC family protein [Casimicrobiaceae bacterium]|nr:TolC family protein [Casimicrobiaceae bacterium]